MVIQFKRDLACRKPLEFHTSRQSWNDRKKRSKVFITLWWEW